MCITMISSCIGIIFITHKVIGSWLYNYTFFLYIIKEIISCVYILHSCLDDSNVREEHLSRMWIY